MGVGSVLWRIFACWPGFGFRLQEAGSLADERLDDVRRLGHDKLVPGLMTRSQVVADCPAPLQPIFCLFRLDMQLGLPDFSVYSGISWDEDKILAEWTNTRILTTAIALYPRNSGDEGSSQAYERTRENVSETDASLVKFRRRDVLRQRVNCLELPLTQQASNLVCIPVIKRMRIRFQRLRCGSLYGREIIKKVARLMSI